jgi:hypothetical protein
VLATVVVVEQVGGDDGALAKVFVGLCDGVGELRVGLDCGGGSQGLAGAVGRQRLAGEDELAELEGRIEGAAGSDADQALGAE